MILKIHKKALCQYILIYILLILNGSRIWAIEMARGTMLSIIIEVLIIGLYIACVIRKPAKYRNDYALGILLILIVAITLVRINVGGIGITLWLKWVTYILLTVMAVNVDRHNIITRFINVVSILGIISIIGYGFQIIYPDALEQFLVEYNSNFSYKIWKTATEYDSHNYSAWGRFLFTFDEAHITRNVGVFSEPGVYQIVLNVSLFILVFLRKYVSVSSKGYTYRVVVIMLALITCQSTTGYISFFAILMAFLLSKQSHKLGNATKAISILLCAVVVILIVDYSANGMKSYVGEVFLSKLFSESGKLDLSVSTGVYRLSTIMTSLGSMLSHPWGVGYDTIHAQIQDNLQGSAGGVLLETGAAIGVLPFILIICWQLWPVMKSKSFSASGKFAFLFVFANTSLAQSEEFYTTIILVTMIFYTYSKHGLWKGQSNGIGEIDICSQSVKEVYE